MKKRKIHLGHSPDPDDAFMFYALSANKIDTKGLEFVDTLMDIETLNRWAQEGRLEVTAVSLHAFAYVSQTYALLTSGASIGRNYGPVLVSKKDLHLSNLRGRPIAIPGTLTTAFLVLSLCLRDFQPVVVPFDKVLDVVAKDRAAAGLVIHEGQLTYGKQGLKKVLDLGQWWHRETGLPLPLGVDVVRKDLGPEMMKLIGGLVRESIQYAFSHRDEALNHALKYARGVDRAEADQFVSMYVNQDTLDMGEEGRRAVKLLLERGYERGIIRQPPALEFIN